MTSMMNVPYILPIYKYVKFKKKFRFSLPEDGHLRSKHVVTIIYSQLYQYIPIVKRDTIVF
jgi:hypothetical protein